MIANDLVACLHELVPASVEVEQGTVGAAPSARGSGGIRARLHHHFRPGKAIHWHIDELTNAAAAILALAIPGGSECDIVERMLESKRFEPAMQGFGSSDCRCCIAHLLRPSR